MIHWGWLIPAILGGATLGVCFLALFGPFVSRTPPSPISDHPIAKPDRIPGRHG